MTRRCRTTIYAVPDAWSPSGPASALISSGRLRPWHCAVCRLSHAKATTITRAARVCSSPPRDTRHHSRPGSSWRTGRSARGRQRPRTGPDLSRADSAGIAFQPVSRRRRWDPPATARRPPGYPSVRLRCCLAAQPEDRRQQSSPCRAGTRWRSSAGLRDAAA